MRVYLFFLRSVRIEVGIEVRVVAAQVLMSSG